jgi:hypothetical protein
MLEKRGTRALGLISSAAVLVMVATIGASGQKPGPAEVAAKMTGAWKLNRELSPAVGAPGRGGPGGRGRGGPAFAMSGTPALQRGGGRGGGDLPTASSNADLPPDVLAAQAAIRDLQQIAELITVKATPETIAIADPRGEHTYAIDNKPTKIDTTGVKIDVRTKWDKLAIRQDFSSPQTRLIRSWEVDEQGRLVLKVKLESMTMNSKEVKAVYDKQ